MEVDSKQQAMQRGNGEVGGRGEKMIEMPMRDGREQDHLMYEPAQHSLHCLLTSMAGAVLRKPQELLTKHQE